MDYKYVLNQIVRSLHCLSDNRLLIKQKCYILNKDEKFHYVRADLITGLQMYLFI